jgi:hypothetical protein
MRMYRAVEVSEVGLEDMVRRAPALIEEGLRFVDRQAFTTRGPLDVLLVDSGNALVVAELKVVEDDGMLVQGLDYYDYVARNLSGFASAYQQHGMDASQEPRLLLLAPSYSVTLLNRIKWVKMPVSLFTVQCIEFEDAEGDIIPVYTEIAAPTLPEPPSVYDIERRYSYITDRTVRQLAKRVVAQLRGFDAERVSVDPTKYDISAKVVGRVFAYLAPRRQYFLVYTNDADGKWTGYRVNSEGDLDGVMSVVRANFEKVGGGALNEVSSV